MAQGPLRATHISLFHPSHFPSPSHTCSFPHSLLSTPFTRPALSAMLLGGRKMSSPSYLFYHRAVAYYSLFLFSELDFISAAAFWPFSERVRCPFQPFSHLISLPRLLLLRQLVSLDVARLIFQRQVFLVAPPLPWSFVSPLSVLVVSQPRLPSVDASTHTPTAPSAPPHLTCL